MTPFNLPREFFNLAHKNPSGTGLGGIRPPGLLLMSYVGLADTTLEVQSSGTVVKSD